MFRFHVQLCGYNAFKIRSLALHGKLLACPTPSTTHQNSLRRSISPSKSKDQHATSEQSIQTQPELLYQQSPNTMLLAATSYTRVLLIPCYLVPHILGITNAHMNVFGDEVLWAKFEEVSWKGITDKAPAFASIAACFFVSSSSISYCGLSNWILSFICIHTAFKASFTFSSILFLVDHVCYCYC